MTRTVRHWRRWLPHRASGVHRFQGTVRQIVGGRRWSLCLVTAMEPVTEQAGVLDEKET